MSVHIDKQDAVWTIVLARSHRRNAVDRATAEALADAFRAFEADAAARVAVLWGEGGHFCAGADLKEIADGQPNRTERDGDGPMGPTRMQLSKPVIAAVAGYAVGGGLELALWCDLRIVEEDAVLGFLNRRWGVPLVDGGTVRLPRIVGMSRALDLILTGRDVRAPEALAMGLANRVVAPGQARAAAEALAHELAQHPPLALRGDRASAHEQWGMAERAALANEFLHGEAALREETTAGARRFAARRARSDFGPPS